jgi:predicted membrane protein
MSRERSSRSRYLFSVIGDITENAVPAGWTDESIVVLIGDVKLDLRNRPPGQGATLRIFRLIGDVRVRVPPGSRVSIRGATLLGDRSVDVSPGDGSPLELRVSGLLGDLEVTE